jgi:hypothetical protein
MQKAYYHCRFLKVNWLFSKRIQVIVLEDSEFIALQNLINGAKLMSSGDCFVQFLQLSCIKVFIWSSKLNQDT